MKLKPNDPIPAIDEDLVSEERVPERGLLAAILCRSILDYLSDSFPVEHGSESKRHQLKIEAKNWIFDDNSNSIFSFIFICQELNTNPYDLRKALHDPETRGRLLKMRFHL